MEQPSLGERVAAELRAERGRKRMNIEDLAKKSGIGERTMQRYLLGTRVPNIELLDEICRALGVSVRDIMERATEPVAPSMIETGRRRSNG